MANVMHDDSGASDGVSQVHEQVVAAMSRLLSDSFAPDEATIILSCLGRMTQITDRGFQLWIWGTTAKFFSKQSGCFERPDFGAVANELFSQLVQQVKIILGQVDQCSQVAEGMKHIQKMTQLYLVFLTMAQKHPALLQHVNPVPGMLQIVPLVNEDIRAKLKKFHSVFKGSFKDERQAYLVLPQEDLLAEFPAEIGGLSLPVLLDQLPSLFGALGKSEFKTHLALLLRFYIVCKPPLLRHLLKSCLQRIISAAPFANSSHLFTSNLAEQIHVATLFPFSIKPGSEVHGRELGATLMALWQRMLPSSDPSLELAISAVTNLFREGILNASPQVSAAIDLIRSTVALELPHISGIILSLMRCMARSCSFKNLLDLLELVKKLKPSPSATIQAWLLLATLSTTRSPEALHRRLPDTLVLFIQNCRAGPSVSWPLEHVKLATLAMYAKYSACLDIFEHPSLAPIQAILLPFFQRQLPEGADIDLSSLKVAIALLPYEMAGSSDPVVRCLKRLAGLISECSGSSRHRYVPRLEELLYQCQNDTPISID